MSDESTGVEEKPQPHIWSLPILNYPEIGETTSGRIVFPERANGKIYLAYEKAKQRQKSDPKESMLQYAAFYRVAKAIAEEIEVDGLDELPPFEECDAAILSWIYYGVMVYVNRFLAIRY